MLWPVARRPGADQPGSGYLVCQLETRWTTWPSLAQRTSKEMQGGTVLYPLPPPFRLVPAAAVSQACLSPLVGASRARILRAEPPVDSFTRR